MCGITGWYNQQKELPTGAEALVEGALETLRKRGPDHAAVYYAPGVRLGHARLSILDVSTASHQPMHDDHLTIVFNGEIFNYQDLKSELEQAGELFRTTSDTEVLLRLYKREGPACLSKLNGFFAFVIYNPKDHSLFFARDRFGVKPLMYYYQDNNFWFGSELKALFAMGCPSVLDYSAMHLYFRLNYLPPDVCIAKGVVKLKPGWYGIIKANATRVELNCYYTLPHPFKQDIPSYESAQSTVFELMEDAVKRRLIADVPVGVFLSGGLDSSIVAAMAARHQPRIHSFSVGFDNPIFDETPYATAVAKHINTEHTVIRLSFETMSEAVVDILDYFDEPFADASAVNVFLLSQHVAKYVKVALSGDGADEIAGGYSKHVGHAKAATNSALNQLLRALYPMTRFLSGNRNTTIGRKFYQLKRYTEGLRLTPAERYLTWASVYQNTERLLKVPADGVLGRLAPYIGHITDDLNSVLVADTRLVLPGDMLTKVDLMSMANSLEVRSPFMDYRVVGYLHQLPADYKIKGQQRKRILHDAFRALLPAELYYRPKQGFEVPMAQWLNTTLRPLVHQYVLDRDLIEYQGLFHFSELERLSKAVFSGSTSREDWTLWAVIVFQHCYKRYFSG